VGPLSLVKRAAQTSSTPIVYPKSNQKRITKKKQPLSAQAPDDILSEDKAIESHTEERERSEYGGHVSSNILEEHSEPPVGQGLLKK